MGVFQIESRAQMQMLQRTRPENLDDLTVQVALVRPGPIQGGAVHPYIERRKALRADPGYEIPYEHPSLEPVLRGHARRDRLPGPGARGGDGLRRLQPGRGRGAAPRDEPQALGGGDPRLRATSSSTARSSAASSVEVAERVFEQIVGFSGFGFPKAHSAAFGLLAYQSTWLRVHYGPEFLCALLNEQPMGFYPPDSLVHEAQRRGMEVLPPYVASQRCRLPGRERRAGRCGSGSATSTACRRRRSGRSWPSATQGGAWRSLGDLAARSGAWRDTLEKLAWAGACDALADGPSRVAAARRSGSWAWRCPGVPVAEAARSWRCRSTRTPAPELRALTAWERLLADYGSTGVTLREHPLAADAARPAGRPRARARSSSATATAAGCASPGWWSRASARRPPRASRSCCSRTSWARST